MSRVPQLRTWLTLVSLLILTLLPLPGASAADPPKPAPEVQALLDKGKEAQGASRSEDALRDALRLFNEALEKSRALGDKVGEGNMLRNIGNVYLDTGQPQKALAFLEQALPLFRQAGDKAGEASTLGNIGFVQEKPGRLPDAERSLKDALALVESVRDELGGLSEAKVSFLTSTLDTYRRYIHVLLKRNKPADAFAVV